VKQWRNPFDAGRLGETCERKEKDLFFEPGILRENRTIKSFNEKPGELLRLEGGKSFD
jgi:hypothetical protein